MVDAWPDLQPIMAVMRRSDTTWLVLVRDVSHAVRVRGHSQLSASLVLDVGTGLVRAAMVGADESEAVTKALEAAVAKAASPLLPGLPGILLSGPGLGGAVARALHQMATGGPPPEVTEIEPPREAEDVFDSFVGHMAGRSQPDDPPAPEDYEALYSQTLDFYQAAPWSRWHDGIDLAVDITVDGSTTHHTAVIMGNAGVQHGLVLYPGGHPQQGFEMWEPGHPPPVPGGTLLCTLDRRDEPPVDLVAKAGRYGWPTDAGLVPVFLRIGTDGDGGDPGRLDVHRMAVALAAVTRHHARGLVPAGTRSEATSGRVALPGGESGGFSLRQQAPPGEADQADIRLHQARFDLIPNGTPVVLGHMPWASLDALRASARIHRPAPRQAPPPSGTEVPLFAILAKPGDGDRIAAMTAELDPFGVVAIEAGDGQAVFALGGSNGVEVLLQVAVDDPGYPLYKRRLRQTKGRQVVMIADESTARGEGTVYGLFECHHPAPPATPPGAGRPRPRNRRRK